MSNVFRRNLQSAAGRHAVEVRESDGSFTASVDGESLDVSLRAGAELGEGREILFDGPNGTQDRTIEMGPHESGFHVKETATHEGSTTVMSGVYGGDDGPEEAMAAYQHLIDP